MIVIGSFRHSIELEQALQQLERLGIPRSRLLVVSMDSYEGGFGIDIQNVEESASKGVEVGFASATALSVIGTCIGFRLPWGPVIGGLAAAVVGFAIGKGIHALLRGNIRRYPKVKPEVTVIVQCRGDQFEPVQRAMWTYRAMTVGVAHASTE